MLNLQYQMAGAQMKRKFNQSKEIKMFVNRVFNLLIVIALVVLVGLTVREASATSTVITADQSHGSLAKAEECASLPARSSIHPEYIEERGLLLPYTKDGPTGLDGGLIELLSNYRGCSQ
jgi:hypothetical protein